MSSRDEFDVAIVGGGPAGLAAAIALQQQGFRCVLCDAQQPPVDKACGEGIMPEGAAALTKLGVRLEANSGFAIRGIRFCELTREVSAEFRSNTGIGIRRLALHTKLRRRAEQLGVDLRWGACATLGEKQTLITRSGSIRYKWLVIADGQRSTLASKAGFALAQGTPPRFAVRQHYCVRPWTEHVEVHWGDRKQVYVTPVDADEIGIAVLAAKPLSVEAALSEFPKLRDRLAGAEMSSRARNYVTSNRRYKHVVKERAILLGDASGSVDAITGEGLSIAFRQALALVDALRADAPVQYERAHRRMSMRPWNMAKLLLLLDGLPALRSYAMDALSKRPALFARLLAVHTGASGWSDILLRDSAYLAAQAVRFALARRSELIPHRDLAERRI